VRPKYNNTKALPKVMMVERTNAITSSSWKPKAIAMHHVMKNASMKRSDPRIFAMSLQFIMLNTPISV
jgi:hypothetical protein